MSTLRLTPLTGEQLLERGLGDRVEINARPRPMPREVFVETPPPGILVTPVPPIRKQVWMPQIDNDFQQEIQP